MALDRDQSALLRNAAISRVSSTAIGLGHTWGLSPIEVVKRGRESREKRNIAVQNLLNQGVPAEEIVSVYPDYLKAQKEHILSD